MQSQNKSYKKIGLTAGLLLLIGIIATATMSEKEENVTASQATVPEVDTVASTSKTTNPTSSLKDGVYTAIGSYTSPAGPETIGVTVTLKDSIVIGATVLPGATNKISVQMQGKFIDGYKEFVMGKNINEINLTKVSGSSLTPKGFNDALAKIRQEAQS